MAARSPGSYSPGSYSPMSTFSPKSAGHSPRTPAGYSPRTPAEHSPRTPAEHSPRTPTEHTPRTPPGRNGYDSGSAHYTLQSPSLSRVSSGSLYSPEAGRVMEAASIKEPLMKGFVVLTGGVDRQSGPILFFPASRDPRDVPPQDITMCLSYLSQIPSLDSRRHGFTVVIDNRNGCWTDLKPVLLALKQSIGDVLKQVLIIVSGSSMERRMSHSYSREKTNVNIEPHFISASKLQAYIDLSQLTTDLGGDLHYSHSKWLRIRLELEQFLRDIHVASRQLDSAETQIAHLIGQEERWNARQVLQKHHYLQESILMSPTQVIQQGREIITDLSQGSENAGFQNDRSSSGDVVETKRQVKRMLSFLEAKVDKVQQFLDDQDQALSHNVQLSDWEDGVKTVTNWIIGPGTKLFVSQKDVGDSYESANLLRKRHEEIELKCTDTYGHYAEFRHNAEEMIKHDHPASDDITAQRNYMDTVCRSFATQLERRRILLIASVRFFRAAEQFGEKLDNLLELLCTDIELIDVEAAQEALDSLQDRCSSIDESAAETFEAGQTLIDELSLAVKNSFGIDATPDNGPHEKYIMQRLDELQQRKLRCDELADVRRLKLHQILQLRTCERDAEKAINWIQELCDTMSLAKGDADQIQMGQQNFETTAKSTYEYGKQLLQAALVLRRSLRYDLAPNHSLAQQLELAWKNFAHGANEEATRLSAMNVFMVNVDKLLGDVTNLQDYLSDEQARGVLAKDLVQHFTPWKDQISADHRAFEKSGHELLDRLAIPILMFDEGSKKKKVPTATLR